MKDFAKIIHDSRKNKGMTQADLGKQAGVPQSHISRIESGSIDIRISSLQEIVRLLDLELTLVPRNLIPLVQGIVRGDDNMEQKSAWQVDEQKD